MTYTGYENHSVEELVRQIEHEGPSRAVAELLSRVSDLQGDIAEQTAEIARIEADTAEQIEALEKENARLEDELATAHEKIEMLEELINATGETK